MWLIDRLLHELEIVKLDIVVNWLIAASKKPKVVKLDIVVNWLIAASKKPEVEKLDSVLRWILLNKKKFLPPTPLGSS